MIARGIRNQNPGNIRGSPNRKWQGEVGRDDKDFVVFDTPENGIRALAKLLVSYEDVHGLKTVRGIINRWAPPVENDTGAYVNAVAAKIGVSPDSQISTHSRNTLALLTIAIIQHENGSQPYSADQIGAGVDAALGVKLSPQDNLPNIPNIGIDTQPAAPIEERSTTLPQPEKSMPLLAALLPSILALFAPRAQAQLQKVTGAGPEVLEPFLASLFSKITQATGQADPVQAVAALKAQPQAVAAVQESALDYLDKLAPIMDRLDGFDKSAWSDSEASKAAEFERNKEDPQQNIQKPMMNFTFIAVAFVTLFTGGLLGWQMYLKGGDEPNGQLIILFVMLVTTFVGMLKTQNDWGFGSSRNSSAKDATIAQLANK